MVSVSSGTMCLQLSAAPLSLPPTYWRSLEDVHRSEHFGEVPTDGRETLRRSDCAFYSEVFPSENNIATMQNCPNPTIRPDQGAHGPLA